ncbi:hypothetical protein [Paludibaculum fermentans]|uniref:PepSY domain-containing protein n=1 Tax=Paludibaculum fermentans TaxID=1473598 RepID=A0A7S7NQS9_PALFE|nr:hypothetical protein [Paludibaculum fermentans]QOY88097.1 hypothetical protein IRI77_36075 [Paludibaculum fermentans]
MKIPALRMTLLCAAASCCFGQAMVEHAAAAAVGTAGSVGGKAISNGLDKVFGRVAAVTKEAEGNPEPEAKVKAQAGTKSMGDSSSTSGAAHSRRTRVTRRSTAAAEASEPAAAYGPARSYAATPPRIVATPQEFAKLTTGAPRSELAERLGTASYKISVPEEGHLTEIYRYANHGVAVGTVRVVDGVVSEVKPAKN